MHCRREVKEILKKTKGQQDTKKKNESVLCVCVWVGCRGVCVWKLCVSVYEREREKEEDRKTG